MEGAGDSMSPGGKGGESSGDQDSGISLQIPSWKGPPLVRRHSIYEDRIKVSSGVSLVQIHVHCKSAIFKYANNYPNL